jgi:hypothetical protein
MAKKLLICPTCEIVGKKEVLGEITDRGTFSILRFHKGETEIFSDSFVVICGVCKTAVFRRQNANIKKSK